MLTFAMILVGVLVSAVAFFVFVVEVMCRDRPTVAPPTCTRDDPRCIVVATRLRDARECMKARGVRLLLVDRPWQRDATIPRRITAAVLPFRGVSK